MDLWLAHLDEITDEEFGDLGALLNPEETAHAEKFFFPRDRQRQIATRGYLRHLLGEKLNRPAVSPVFEKGEHGKPTLVRETGNGPHLHFNLSHTSGWALFALALDREVGVDIESADALSGGRDLDGLAARIFSANELQTWRTLPDRASQRAAFLRAWTKKEALGKATGEGLGRAESGAACDWILHELAVPAGLVAMLAVAAHRP